MGNFTRATFLFHVSSDLIRLDAKVCSESSPGLGDDAAVMTRGENNMVLLDAELQGGGMQIQILICSTLQLTAASWQIV